MHMVKKKTIEKKQWGNQHKIQNSGFIESGAGCI